MKLSNSIKLAMANFSLFWKILVYKTLAFGVIVLLLLPIFGVLGKCLAEVGFWGSVADFFSVSVFQNFASVSDKLFACVANLFASLVTLANVSLVALIYLLLVLFIIAPFILKLSDVPVSESVYSYMASLSKNSFMVNFVDGFGKSAGYSILKTILEVPFWCLFLSGIYGILSLTNYGLTMQILCPLILFVFAVFMLDVKASVFNGWASSIVVFNTCAGKAFNKALVAVKRKFLSTLSSFAVVITIMFACLYIFGVYSLIIILPLYSLIISVFGQVLFFESQGMNYYISPDRIIMPRKLEQADSIKKVKSII